MIRKTSQSIDSTVNDARWSGWSISSSKSSIIIKGISHSRAPSEVYPTPLTFQMMNGTRSQSAELFLKKLRKARTACQQIQNGPRNHVKVSTITILFLLTETAS